MQLTTRATDWFSASHEYPENPIWSGAQPHGHTYEVAAEVEGEMDPKTHRVRGSKDLVESLRAICAELDGRDLDRMMAGSTSTPEVVAAWILERVAATVPKVRRVTISIKHPTLSVSAEREVDR